MIVAALLGLYMLVAQLVTHSACFFESTVGLPCPGCGLSRAYAALITLRFEEAFRWHPLFWYIPVMAGVWLYKRRKYGKKDVQWFTWFLWGSLALFIGVYAVRMVLFFPHTQPLTINPLSFTQRAVSMIRTLLRI